MQQPQERLLTDPCSGDDPCARILLAQDTLQRFGRLRFKALGSSMLPAVAPGDILTFRTARPGDLVVGRIVLMAGDGRLVAHRLLSHDQGLLTTMGDSLRVPDAPLPAARRSTSGMARIVCCHSRRDSGPFPSRKNSRARLIPGFSRVAASSSSLTGTGTCCIS